MNHDEAKEILRQMIEFMQLNFGDLSKPVTEGLQDVIHLIDRQHDEIDSLWFMVDEMSKSEIHLHEKELMKELTEIFKDKRKIAKVSEA